MPWTSTDLFNFMKASNWLIPYGTSPQLTDFHLKLAIIESSKKNFANGLFSALNCLCDLRNSFQHFEHLYCRMIHRVIVHGRQ